MSAEGVSPVTTYFRVSDGVRVRYADNKADSDITELLLAPWPETLWAFRRIWDRVSAIGRPQVTSRGNKHRRNTAAWSSTGSWAGTAWSQRANPRIE